MCERAPKGDVELPFNIVEYSALRAPLKKKKKKKKKNDEKRGKKYNRGA